MSTAPPSRRSVGCILLALALIGAFVVLRLLLKASFLALGLAFKMLAACGGILFLLLLVWLGWRVLRKNK